MAAATPGVPEVALTSQEKRLDLSAEAGEAKGQVKLQRLSLQIFRYLLVNLSYIQFFCGLPSPFLLVPCSFSCPNQTSGYDLYLLSATQLSLCPDQTIPPVFCLVCPASGSPLQFIPYKAARNMLL